MMRFCRVFCCAAMLAAPLAAFAQPRPSADEFVPVSEAPVGEQIPAIRLVASAYGFVWVVLAGYVWSVGSRLQKVEREIADLERRRT